MDISKLLPFIKEAVAMTVTPEEVAAQMQKQHQTKMEDKQRETVDNEVIEQDEVPSDDGQNEEGQLLENSFQELEVEDAIDQAKEEKLLSSDPQVGNASTKLGTFREAMTERFAIKTAATWLDLLKQKI